MEQARNDQILVGLPSHLLPRRSPPCASPNSFHSPSLVCSPPQRRLGLPRLTPRSTGGTLSFINSTPGNVSFPSVTLNGSNQNHLQDADARHQRRPRHRRRLERHGDVDALHERLGHLPAGSVTIASARAWPAMPASRARSPRRAPRPLHAPSAAVAPIATKMYNAAANTGMGAQTVTPNWQLLVPASAKAGSYTSTWTFSLVSGP